MSFVSSSTENDFFMPSSSKPKQQTLWSITQGQRFRYSIATLCSTISLALTMVIPVVSMFALDVLVEEDFVHANAWLKSLSDWIAPDTPYTTYLVISAVIGILCTVLASLLQFTRGRLSAVASEGISRKLREVLFDRIHRAIAAFFDHEEVGDLVQRATSDVETVRQFMHNDVDALARALLLLAVMTPVLLWRNVTLTILGLMLIPVIVIGGVIFFRFIAKLFQAADEAEGKLTTVLQENLTGIRVVQAFAQEKEEFARFDEANKGFRDKYIRMTNVEAFYWGGSDLLCTIQMGIVLIGGVYMLMYDLLTLGELFLFLSLTGVVIWRIRQLIDVVEHAGKVQVSLKRIDHLLTAEQEPEQPMPEIERIQGGITFASVSLSYGDDEATDRKCLTDINLSIQPGESLGIIGPPGSGKSTLIRALLRFYPISSGKILLDGIDTDTVDPKWIRSQVASVMQEPFLFSRTVQENLLMGTSDATEVQLQEVTKQASIDTTIAEFANGYSTKIGERGVNLSGGQRQRMALARALLKRAPILILDDVLSGVDTHTEKAILQSLLYREDTPTLIVVAHRLTTVQDLDRIVVMEDGRIVQLGTHQQLMNQEGAYRNLCEIQGLLAESINFEAELATSGR